MSTYGQGWGSVLSDERQRRPLPSLRRPALRPFQLLSAHSISHKQRGSRRHADKPGDKRPPHRERVAVYSSSYTLYGDMNRRMNEVYGQFADEVDVYSIDESFLDLSRYAPADRQALAADLRSTVRKWTGAPTYVGIRPTPRSACGPPATWLVSTPSSLGSLSRSSANRPSTSCAAWPSSTWRRSRRA